MNQLPTLCEINYDRIDLRTPYRWPSFHRIRDEDNEAYNSLESIYDKILKSSLAYNSDGHDSTPRSKQSNPHHAAHFGGSSHRAQTVPTSQFHTTQTPGRVTFKLKEIQQPPAPALLGDGGRSQTMPCLLPSLKLPSRHERLQWVDSLHCWMSPRKVKASLPYMNFVDRAPLEEIELDGSEDRWSPETPDPCPRYIKHMHAHVPEVQLKAPKRSQTVPRKSRKIRTEKRTDVGWRAPRRHPGFIRRPLPTPSAPKSSRRTSPVMPVLESAESSVRLPETPSIPTPKPPTPVAEPSPPKPPTPPAPPREPTPPPPPPPPRTPTPPPRLPTPPPPEPSTPSPPVPHIETPAIPNYIDMMMVHRHTVFFVQNAPEDLRLEVQLNEQVNTNSEYKPTYAEIQLKTVMKGARKAGGAKKTRGSVVRRTSRRRANRATKSQTTDSDEDVDGDGSDLTSLTVDEAPTPLTTIDADADGPLELSFSKSREGTPVIKTRTPSVKTFSDDPKRVASRSQFSEEPAKTATPKSGRTRTTEDWIFTDRFSDDQENDEVEEEPEEPTPEPEPEPEESPEPTPPPTPKEPTPEPPRTPTPPLPKPPKIRSLKEKMDLLDEKQKREAMLEEKRKRAIAMAEKLKGQRLDTQSPGTGHFEDYDWLAKYYILANGGLEMCQGAFEAKGKFDEDGRKKIAGDDLLVALRALHPTLTANQSLFLDRILLLCGYNIQDGADLKLFSVISGLANRIEALDSFMRHVIEHMDFRELENRFYMCRTFWQHSVDHTTRNMSIEQLMLELRAGGVSPAHQQQVYRKLKPLGSLDLLDFLTYVPLFIMIHDSVIQNPFDDTREK